MGGGHPTGTGDVRGKRYGTEGEVVTQVRGEEGGEGRED